MRLSTRLITEATDPKDRERGSGKYRMTTMEYKCTCGHQLAVHSAERVRTRDGSMSQPCFNADVGDGKSCKCECFKKAKVQ